MKKVFLLCLVLSFLLCGCRSESEENGYINYDKMDKEYGQMQTNHDMGDDSVQFEEEAETIKAVVSEYADYLINRDVEGCVIAFPYEFMKMIAKQRSCNTTVAHGVAVGMVEKLFYTKEQIYRDITSAWNESPHEILIDRIDLYPYRDTLKEIYKGYGVTITDSIDIQFTATVNGMEKKDKARFVKLESGQWELDLSFVENHES